MNIVSHSRQSARMPKRRFLQGLILVLLGLIGVASILTMDIPLPPEVAALLEEQFTARQINLLILINPAILVVVAVVVGTLLSPKVHLEVPIIENAVGIRDRIDISGIVIWGVLGGVLTGSILSLMNALWSSRFPAEFMVLNEGLQPSLAARFLYGGLTEEILMRYGLMTLIVWICSKIFKSTGSGVYWAGIFITAIIFAIGHFPVVFQTVGAPSPGLLTYVVIGNSIGGLVFGWLYWKKGLESAFIAHIFAHVVMVSIG
jgi:hypothetical protein